MWVQAHVNNMKKFDNKTRNWTVTALGACPGIAPFAPRKYSDSVVEYIDTKAMSQPKYDDNETEFFNNNIKI